MKEDPEWDFPIVADDLDVIFQTGMTLRDYFAGQALANPNVYREHEVDMMRCAYRIADAMMEARKQ